MSYFFNRIRYTQGDIIHGGLYYLFKNVLLNIVFWVGLFGILGFMWLYAFQSGLKTDITVIIGFCLYLFLVSKVYRERINVPVVTVSWVFTGVYSLFELFIAIVCASINAVWVYNNCESNPKSTGYFLATLIFVYFCLRVSLISVIRNWKKSNPFFLLLHLMTISFLATCLITLLLSNFGSMMVDLVLIVILFLFLKSIGDGEWCPIIVFKV